MWIDEIDYPVFSSPSSAVSIPIQSSNPPSRSTTPSIVAQTPRVIPATMKKTNSSKIRKNIWEQTQTDQSIPPQNTNPVPEDEKENSNEKNIPVLLSKWDEVFLHLHTAVPSGSIDALQKQLQPFLDSNSLLNEVIFVSGFDDKVILFNYYLFDLFLIFLKWKLLLGNDCNCKINQSWFRISFSYIN